MPPPPRPPTFSRAASYRQLLDLKARLGQQAPRSKTSKIHIAHALDLLDWISIRRWKEMQEVSIDFGKSRVNWTDLLDQNLQRAVADSRQNLSILLGILIQFKNICSNRLRAQAYKPRGLSILLQRVKSLPETSSDDINCTKRSLLQLQQRHFAKLFLHEDERGSVIDTILAHLREISSMIETAEKLFTEDPTIEEENEAGDCLDEADDQAKGICDLCLGALGLDWIRIWNRQVGLMGLNDEFLIRTSSPRSSLSSRPVSDRPLSPPAHSLRHLSLSSFSPSSRRSYFSMGSIDSATFV